MMDEIIPEPAPHRGYRPPAVLQPEDFRTAVTQSAEAAAIIDEIRAAFLASAEIRALHGAFDEITVVGIEITSSRKYTRFKFPNCPKLRYKIKCILTRHRCEIIGHDHTYGRHMTVEIGIPRLGCCDERIAWVPT